MTTTFRAIIVGIAISTFVATAVAIVLFFNPANMNPLEAQQGKLQDISSSDSKSPAGNDYRQANVTVKGQTLIADISATNEQRTKGLSVKDGLSENQAMLFVFENEAEHRFWMKDMKFPIDIIWMDANKTVIHVEHDLQPCSTILLCTTYKANGNSLYVLETVGGFAQKYGITKGTHIDFDLNN
ncbi:MAG: DUF192 domain-containing protein [Thermoproteota archaeon]|nr:DUF192 domain-containing protein [Thermoproteota archaeon]